MPTITGRAKLPGGTTALTGTWYVRIRTNVNAATDPDGTVRGGIEDAYDGGDGATMVLPAGGYEARFESSNLNPDTGQRDQYGWYPFDVAAANLTWGQIMTTPVEVPVTPADVTLVEQYRDEVETARNQVVAAGNTNDTIMASRANDDASAFRAALTRNGKKPVGRDDLLLNVRDFGATGDGATNDTAAFTTALAAAAAMFSGAVTVLVPSGIYSVDTIKINNGGVSLRGVGAGTILRRRPVSGGADSRVIAVNNPSVTVATAAGSYLEGVTIEDLSVDGNNASVSTTIQSTFSWGSVQMLQVKRGLIRNVHVLNPREMGINVYGCEGVAVENCTVDGMLGNYAVNSINVGGNLFSGNPGFTVNDRPSRQIRVRGCRVIRSFVKSGDTASEATIGICVQGSIGVSVTDCEVDLSGEPAARGRIGNGIIFEGGGNGVNGAYQLGRDLIATHNKVRYCKIGIGTVTTAATTTPANDNLSGWTLGNNTVEDCMTGIQVSGRNGVVHTNVVRASTCIAVGVNRANSVEENIAIVGNTLRMIDAPGGGANGISVDKQMAGSYLKGLMIANNLIDGALALATAATPSLYAGIAMFGDVRAFIINTNVIKNTGRYAIGLLNTSSDPTTLRSKDGRIVNNELDNVVAATTAPVFPYYFGIVSTGSDNVMCAMNRIIGGVSMTAATNSIGTGKMTVFANMGPGGVAAVDDSNASLRIGGTATGSRGGNAALASLLTGLNGAQIVRDTTTA